jgi:glycosyltransferase involved in cell wall biosynthesis
MEESRINLLRISTVPHTFRFLLKDQIRHVNNNGFDVSIASSYTDEVPAIEEREGVKHYRLPLTRKFNPLYDIYSLITTIRLLKKLNPTVVHTHSPKAGVIGMLAAKLCSIPLKIHTVAGLPLMEKQGLMKKILIAVDKITYKCADAVIPNSIGIKEYIVQNMYDHPKVKVLGNGSSNGIDLTFFNAESVTTNSINTIKTKYEITADDVVITFVGRICTSKGINELVKAFLLLKEKHKNLKLLLVGSFDDTYPIEKDVHQEIHLNKAIITTGNQEDIRPFLMLSKAFVFPTYREGMPQALMQAIAMRLPCVATDINGCNEIIKDGKTGYLVPIKNIEAIVAKTDDLISDENLKVSFVQKAYSDLASKFEQKTVWKQILDFYRKQLNSKCNL